MRDLKQHVVDVPDFPKAGIVFRDVAPLLRNHLSETTLALSELLSNAEWNGIDACVGVESRGFALAAALATRHQKGFVMTRKKGKLPPPTVREAYELEYGSDALEMKAGTGRVVLIDDVLATGGTLRAAANLCSAAGYTVAALLVLIDLKVVDRFEWRSLPARSVIQYNHER